jgi:hypothetical protein
MSERSVVPCNGCTACCRDERIMLFPEHGDDVDSYDTVPSTMNDALRAKYGDGRRMLRHKPDGSCIYLGEAGCTIWQRAPQICRAFDCRKWFRKFTRNERRELLHKGVMDRAVIKAAQQRLHTLEGP